MPDEPKPPVPPFEIYPVHPDLLAWARQTLDMDEIERGIREIEETGGVSFEEVIAAVEAVVRES